MRSQTIKKPELEERELWSKAHSPDRVVRSPVPPFLLESSNLRPV